MRQRILSYSHANILCPNHLAIWLVAVPTVIYTRYAVYNDDGIIECLWCDGLEVVFVIEELPTVVKKTHTRFRVFIS